MRHLSIKTIYRFIKSFYNKYEQMPNVGFLAGYYSVSKRTIYNYIIKLEQKGLLNRIKKDKYNTSFNLKDQDEDKEKTKSTRKSV